MAPRLASSVLVGALRRRAELEGGYAAVLAKGDATAGAILVILVERVGRTALYERTLQPDGCYRWAPHDPPPDAPDAVPAFVARRRRSDPDLWVLELHVPSIERFAAGMNAFD
ncbi:MAG: DUF1491 family protein [Alphaproteobacteria bacterium]|nr:DUF1491 family protein [Alphaproteobacteria bacterium]